MSLKLPGAVLADEAVVSIVRGAVASVEGARLDRPGRIARVLPGRGDAVAWRLDRGALVLDLDVAVAYGSVLPDVARQVRERVAAEVGAMTGLRIRAVDVTVTGLDG
jgi:uncharacterized alkaline shock family protein YloU